MGPVTDPTFIPDPPRLLGLYAVPAENRHTRDLVALVWQIGTPTGHKIEIEYRQARRMSAFAVFEEATTLVRDELQRRGMLDHGADHE